MRELWIFRKAQIALQGLDEGLWGRDVAQAQREARQWRTYKSQQGSVFYLISYRDP